MKKVNKNMTMETLLLVVAIMATSPALLAQDDLLSDTDSVLNSEQIDIDGRWDDRAPVEKSSEEIVSDAKGRAEKRNVKSIAKKIAKIKVPEKQVKKIKAREAKNLSKRITEIFSGGEGEVTDTVTVQHAAKVVAPLPVAPVEKKGIGVKIIPSVGAMYLNGDGVDFESKMNIGLSVESMLSSRFSLGFSVGYSSLDLSYMDDEYNQYDPYSDYHYTYDYTYYNDGYTDTYGNSRELSYDRLSLELNSKFFFTVGTRLRPYLGLGVSYNRTGLKYKDQGTTYYDPYYNMSYGEEEYSSSYIAGSALLGMEISFSDMIGMNVEAGYSKGFTSGMNTDKAPVQNRDQENLERIGVALEEAHVASIKAGIVISF